jgi:hypothetical protein
MGSETPVLLLISLTIAGNQVLVEPLLVNCHNTIGICYIRGVLATEKTVILNQKHLNGGKRCSRIK